MLICGDFFNMQMDEKIFKKSEAGVMENKKGQQARREITPT
jgi:hypothetical protein